MNTLSQNISFINIMHDFDKTKQDIKNKSILTQTCWFCILTPSLPQEKREIIDFF